MTHLTDMHGCVFMRVCVQNVFARGDKQLLCTPGPNPGLRMVAVAWPPEAFALHRTGSQCALTDPCHACANSGKFLEPGTAPLTRVSIFFPCLPFFPPSLFKLPLTVQVKYPSTQPTETSDLIDVSVHGEDGEEGEGREQRRL